MSELKPCPREAEALDIIESLLDVADMKCTGPLYADDPPRNGLCRIPEEDAAILRQYIAYRRAQPANEPLTLEQLREMDGKPVWVNHRANVKFGEPWKVVSEWMIVDAKVERILGLKRNVPFDHIGPSKALAYRRPPERSESDAV